MQGTGIPGPTILTSGYRQPAGVYDEMSEPAGKLRPHWERYMQALSAMGPGEVAHRWQTARQRIRENGVTYNVYGDPRGMDRPWLLDAIPLIIPQAEWEQLEAGLIQRARLLNWILSDLYGPQRLLYEGHIPPALVFGNPGFWRPCHGIRVPGGTHLHLLAVDLARSPDGQWWVIADRTQAPSGAGYAVENRVVLGETFPDLFRESGVCRVASFFREFRRTLLHLAPGENANAKAVLLTPGPYNETYFEHSYLSRYLNFPLVQGGDLTVRGNRVFLKSLEGLKPVDVILRRVDDSFCDPLELRGDSYLGVAGLVGAVRAGNVTVANALGSGLIETSAFMPFLPGLSRRLLGESLTLPSVATWWCGQPQGLQYVRDNLNYLVIKPAFPQIGKEPVMGGALTREEQTELLGRIAERPQNYAGQEMLNLSSAPVWVDDGLASRRVVLRVYLAAVGDSWIVMPGGLARVSPTADTQVVSMQRGGGSKDIWVLSSGPVDRFTMLPPTNAAAVLHRGGSSDLPSRAADHLFWLGRYAERCEHLCRILRAILIRLAGQADVAGLDSCLKLLQSLESPYSRLAKDDPQGHLDRAREMEQEILSLIFEEERRDSLYANFNRAARASAQVRDRLSTDMLRIVSQFAGAARAQQSEAWGYVSTADALAVLSRCVATLAALRGIEMENMTRGPGWRFLNIGRRIERSVQMVELFGAMLVPVDADSPAMLELLLEVADSSITYRSRYFTTLQPAPVLDLLMNDRLNPRSLAFQVEDLSQHSRVLAGMPSGAGWPLGQQREVEAAAARLFDSDVVMRFDLEAALERLGTALPAFSDALTSIYFSHALLERST